MPIIEVPADILREVRHACKTALFKHKKKAQDDSLAEYKRAQSAKTAHRLGEFLDRLPDVKHGKDQSS